MWSRHGLQQLWGARGDQLIARPGRRAGVVVGCLGHAVCPPRSEEHTSELQSRQYLVCRLLLEKKRTVSNVVMRVSNSTFPSIATVTISSSSPTICISVTNTRMITRLLLLFFINIASHKLPCC